MTLVSSEKFDTIRFLHKPDKSKPSDKWKRDLHIVVDISSSGTSIYKIQKDFRKGPIRTLHRYLLLPFNNKRGETDCKIRCVQ